MAAVLREFFGVDARALRAFRIALGCALLGDLATRATALTAHYSDAGVLPRAMAPTPPWWRAAFFVHGSPAWAALLFCVGALLALSLITHKHVRLVSVLAYLLWSSLHARNMFVRQAGDSLVRHLLLWSALAPAGSPPGGRRPPVWVNGATAALLLQVGMLYLIAGLAKSGPEWSDGSAIVRALSMQHMTSRVGHFLSAYPRLLEPLSYAVVPLETWGVLLLFVPLRLWKLRAAGVAAFAALHGGFIVLLRIGMFPFFDLVALIPFVPPPVWDRLRRPRAPAADRCPGWAQHVLGGVALALFAVAVCLAVHYRGPWRKEIERVGHVLRLSQPFAVFAPSPGRRTFWLVAQATLEGGDERDVLHPQHDDFWERRPAQGELYPGTRWRKYDETIRKTPRRDLLERRIDFLCEKWNGEHPDRKLTGSVHLWEFRQLIRGGRAHGPIERRQLAVHRCRTSGLGLR